MSWSEGYVDEIEYTQNYHRDMSPVVLNFALLNRMFHGRPEGELRYLELGFGQGISFNIHAAATDGLFWGADFHPGQAANARELARASGANAVVLEESFAELAARPDLPEFDVIVLHGIWSWISEPNRKIIVDIARRKLAPGGLFFMSYNTLPAWAPLLPLQKLLKLHTDLTDKAGTGMHARIDSAMAFAKSLRESGARYLLTQPGIAQWLDVMEQQDKNYFAHEYLNADWHPMSFAEAAQELGEAKLSFAASTEFSDHLDSLNLDPAGQTLLAQITHPILREATRDLCVNRQFRRDVWVKGPRPMSKVQRANQLRQMHFALTVPTDAVSLTKKGQITEFTLQAETGQSVIEALTADDYAPKSIAELIDRTNGLDLQSLMDALTVITSNNHGGPAQSVEQARACKKKTDSLNDRLIERAAFGVSPIFLASPVLGAGVIMPGFEPLFVRAIKEGRTTHEAMAEEAWRSLVARGECLAKDGQPISSKEESLVALTENAAAFTHTRLPILKALMVV